MSIQHDVKELNLADEGRESIEWTDRQMPGLRKTIRTHTAKQEKYLASWEEGT